MSGFVVGVLLVIALELGVIIALLWDIEENTSR